MSIEENGVSTVTTAVTTPAGNYVEVAQTRLQELRQMRDLIPHLVIPATPTATVRLSAVAAVSPAFVELMAVAITNEKVLVRDDDAASPAEMRDLMSYAAALEPFADELEAFAHFVRHSVTAARNRACRQALTTYAIAQRLAREPETAYLAPYVADMRRTLGRTRKSTPEELAQKAAERAAKAAAKVAKAAPRLPAPVTTTQQPA
jgi:hypothetical protein